MNSARAKRAFPWGRAAGALALLVAIAALHAIFAALSEPPPPSRSRLEELTGSHAALSLLWQLEAARHGQLHGEPVEVEGAAARFRAALAHLRDHQADEGRRAQALELERAAEALIASLSVAAEPGAFERRAQDLSSVLAARVAEAEAGVRGLEDAARKGLGFAERTRVALATIALALVAILGVYLAGAASELYRKARDLAQQADRDRRRLEEVLAKLPVPVVSFDGPGLAPRHANPKAEALLGSFAGGTELHPLGGLLGALVEGTRSGTPASISELKVDLVRDGKPAPACLDLEAHPLRGPTGEVDGALLVARDVTEQVASRARAERLEELAVRLAGGLTLEDIARVAAEACLDAGADAAFVALREPGGEIWVRASRGLAPGPARLPRTLSEAAGAGGPIWADREEASARLPGFPPPSGNSWARVGVAPMRADGRPVGLMGVAFQSPVAGPGELEALLGEFARQAAQALSRAALYEAERAARAEAERAARSREEALALVETLFASAPVGLGFWDRNLKVVRFNDALARMVGRPSDRTPEAMAGLLPGFGGEQAFDRDLERVARGEPVIGLERRGRTPAAPGDERIWLESWYPVKAAGEVIGLGAVVEDVTERRRAEGERDRLVAQLQESLKQREEFLSIASHELKTPLTALMLHLDRARKQLRGEVEPLAPALAHARRSASRLARLVDSLLDVSQLTSDRMVLELEPVELGAVVREVSDRLADEIRRSGSPLVVRADRPVVGTWDRVRVESIAASLLENAVKFGRGEPIEVALEEAEGAARLVVRDHGMGISPEDQERIFRRYERAVSSRHFGGLGLGLWIARRSAQALGGSIRVASEPGSGATFVVSLPSSGPGASLVA